MNDGDKRESYLRHGREFAIPCTDRKNRAFGAERWEVPVPLPVEEHRAPGVEPSVRLAASTPAQCLKEVSRNLS